MVKQGYKQTEIGVIPEDWEVRELQQIGIFSKGRGISKSEANSGSIPAIRYGELYTKHHNIIKRIYSFIDKRVADNSIILKKGDILFAGSGETKEEIGKSAAFIDEFEAYVGGDIIILRPNSNISCSKYLGYLTNATFIQKQKSANGQGDAVVHIYSNNLKGIQIPLPPLREQEAIAEALSDADAWIESLEQLIAKKRLIKQGAMQELLTPKEDWEVKKLGEVAEIYQPQTISNSAFTSDGYLVYGANGIIGKYHSYNHKLWQITITCRGSTCGTVNKTIEKVWITGNAMVVNVDNNASINKLFLYYLLSSYDFSNCITGSGQPQIVRSPLIDYIVYLPSLSEQTRIATILSDMDAEIEALEQKLGKARQIKQGMMQELLTGRIRLV